MNERYLFRGKRVDNGEWMKGNLIHGAFFKCATNEDIPYIVDFEGIDYDCFEDLSNGYGYYEVDPSTVGQCTGLRDKNGTLIFEGDILRDEVGTGEVEWLQEYCQVVCRTIEPHQYHALDSEGKLIKTEVIGTIHTTPELMEGNDESTDC